MDMFFSLHIECTFVFNMNESSGGIFMKKILAVVSTLLLVGTFAFAEASIKADDFAQSESITENVTVKGFTLKASDENDVRVKSSKKVAPDGASFNQRIELRGKFKGGVRCISFTAKKGEKVTVYGNSGSKTDKRTIAIQTAKGKSIKEFPGDVYTAAVSVGEATIPEDGEYRVCSTSGGVYIYGITIK